MTVAGGWWSSTHSVHRQVGWAQQYDRVVRWRQRVHGVDFEVDDYLDDFYAFFIICLSLRDWLSRDGAASEDELRDFFARSNSLQICGDIAYGIKHSDLDPKRRSTTGFSIGLQYQALPYVVFYANDAAKQLAELPALVNSCLSEWKAFLQSKSLPLDE